MDTPIEPSRDGTTFRDRDASRPVMRPIMSTRAQPPITDPAARNPFTALNEANKAHEELTQRLEALVERLNGAAPRYTAQNTPAEPGKPGLLPLSRSVATLILERSRHGVALVDLLEEYLQ